MAETKLQLNSIEEVAYKLLVMINQNHSTLPDEKEVLTRYSRCLKVVRGADPEKVLHNLED